MKQKSKPYNMIQGFSRANQAPSVLLHIYLKKLHTHQKVFPQSPSRGLQISCPVTSQAGIVYCIVLNCQSKKSSSVMSKSWKVYPVMKSIWLGISPWHTCRTAICKWAFPFSEHTNNFCTRDKVLTKGIEYNVDVMKYKDKTARK